jgi:3-isopropylmalate/(R)-2-methylmalate dehydratase small subunit
MTPFTKLSARAFVLAVDDIDTDQIIPARFLKGTAKTGLGAHLFADWRERPEFPPLPAGVQILIAGANFGCGSSREHAPWALCDAGFRAIIARSFADIFRENATKNGLLAVAVADDTCARLEAAVRADAATQLHIDLADQRVTLPDGTGFEFPIDPFAKHCLTRGLDQLGYILSFEDRIRDHEARA